VLTIGEQKMEKPHRVTCDELKNFEAKVVFASSATTITNFSKKLEIVVRDGVVTYNVFKNGTLWYGSLDNISDAVYFYNSLEHREGQ
jgi:hypothetical protein